MLYKRRVARGWRGGSEPRVQSNEGIVHVVSAQDVLTH